jgi:WD40 repeat protein
MRPKVEVTKEASYSGHTDCVYAICKGEKETEFYTSGGDGMIVKWDLEVPDEGVLVSKLDNSVYTLHYMDIQKVLVVCENQKGIRFLDVSNHKEIFNIPLNGFTFFDCKQLNNLLFVSTFQGAIYVIDFSKQALIYTIKESTQSARCIAINTEFNELYVGYSDCTIRVFDIHTFAFKNTLLAHSNSVFSLVYLPSSQLLVSGSRDAQLKTWNVNSNYENTRSIPAHLFAINHMVTSANNKYLFTCSMDKSIKVWDADTFTLLKVIDKSRHAGHGTSINKLLYINDKLVSISDDRKISVWDIKIG